ncbi:IS1634 family transposase [Metallibacterium scheffleri]|uniref:IS1634 family transposase n=1 Tax=Metallibacterium scheffleri TaxID=993689 RepID=UPI0023F4458C|nr:IS1634 family transposase [Metallibacterium scheffleri]
MFLKITRSGPRRYLQLVEAFRNEAGKARHRTLVTLGRLDQLDGQLDSVISGLLKATGRADVLNAPVPAIEFESARALGDVWTLNELWKSLGFDGLRRVFGKTRHAIDVEALLRVMVFNRLCDPESKLGVLRWLETVAMPGMDTATITHQHLLRAMDALEDHQGEVDAVVAGLLRPLIDQDLSVVFYDMTTIRTEGATILQDELRQYGMAKEGLIARQVMLGVVQTADGLPIHHEVFAGNTAETPTLLPTLETVLGKFPSIKRVVLVADRGLLSLDNLDALSAVRLKSGAPLEFVLAVPGRRYGEFAEVLGDFQRDHCAKAKKEITGELVWQDRRLIVAHDPERARETGTLRRERLATLETQAAAWSGKLDAQDNGARARGRKLSDSGTKARFYHAVKEARLAHIVKVDLKGDLFAWHIDPDALALAELMDGKLLLVTNVKDLKPVDVVARYKSLADIERGFRILKSEIEIGPVFHRLPTRIRAHASLCFMALILYRVMRQRLKASRSELSPERALDELRKLQQHQIHLQPAGRSVAGISRLSDLQERVFAALDLKKPTPPRQKALL